MQTFSRNCRCALVANIVALVLSLLLAGAPALAHADLARAEPSPGMVLKQSPERVTIWFTEPVEPGFSEIRVLDAHGRHVDNRDGARYQNDPAALSVTLPELPRGTYTVAWRNLSAVDGHPFTGVFAFSVGEPPAGAPRAPAPAARAAEPPVLPSPAEPVLRWLGLLSILAITGSLVFELFISRPVLRASGSRPAIQRMGQQMDARTLRLAWLTVVLFFVASAGELAVKASAGAGIPVIEALGRPMMSVVAQTGWGTLWLWRANLLLGMVVVLALASFEKDRYRPFQLPVWQVFASMFAGGILLTLSLASHGAAATQIRAAAVFSDYLHLLAAGVWVGGIIYLAVVAPPAMKTFRLWQEAAAGRRGRVSVPAVRNAGDFCPASHATAMSRFSALATLSVGALFITGLYSSWAQVTIFPALATPYGTALLVKLGLIIPLLALGAVNLLGVRPRLARDGRALQLLRKTVTGQAVLVVLVLLSVGTLVSLEPARQVASRRGIAEPETVTLRSVVDWAHITVDVQPDRVGPNKFVVYLQDIRGKPVDDASQVDLLFRYPNVRLGPELASATPAGEGRYVLEKSLNLAGSWQLEVSVQHPRQFDAGASFQLDVLPAVGGSGGAVIAPSSETGNWLWGAEVFTLGLLVILVAWMTRHFKPSHTPDTT
ncbi:MAG: copper resistance protein CopC [Chloroflexi bacterium]|nr:copper resistance protein CopC [Chloroflexota bacterium]